MNARKKKIEPKNMKSFFILSVPFPGLNTLLCIIRFSREIVSMQRQVVKQTALSQNKDAKQHLLVMFP